MVKENKKRSTNSRVKKKEHSIAYFDYSLLAILICLICFGLVMLYSTSSYSAMMKQNGDSLFYFKRQVLFCIVGLIGMWIVSRIDYHWYFERSKFFYFISIFMMFLVKTPLGKEVNGAKRWIKLPFGQQLQPAEIAKIAIILFIPALICTMGREIKTLEGIVKVLAWGAFSAAVVFIITENLSTAIIVMGITCIMIFVVHPKTRIFIIIAVGIILIGIVGARVLGMAMETSGNFRLRRILVWLNPEKYASEGGYQIMQALYAIGSGGFFGKGLGNSAQKMIIPEVQNDMILSIICEELGVFGAIMVLILFGMLLYRLLFIAQNAPDLYGSLVVSGIFAHIALQVILNVMVVINCIPTTGITLPFISYGGTSVLFLMAEMGLALGVSSKIKIAE